MKKIKRLYFYVSPDGLECFQKINRKEARFLNKGILGERIETIEILKNSGYKMKWTNA